MQPDIETRIRKSPRAATRIGEEDIIGVGEVVIEKVGREPRRFNEGKQSVPSRLFC